MSRRWLLIAALLCPACAAGSGPPGDSDPISKSDSDPADPPPAAGGDDPAGAADPPADPGDPTADPSDSPPPGVSGHIDCDAIWAIMDDLACGLAKLICAAVEDIPVAGDLVPCDIAVPLACGLSSAAADAAADLCSP
ncbi:MAG: hypothetical protein QM820_63940 [Minicystis sp.]